MNDKLRVVDENRVENILRHLGFEAGLGGYERLSIKLTKRYMTDEQFETSINHIARVIDEIAGPMQK